MSGDGADGSCCAREDSGLDVVVNLRPPHIAASEFLRAHITTVRTVKLVQDIPLQAE